MAHPTAPLLRRERYLILSGLLILSALAWGLLIWQTGLLAVRMSPILMIKNM